MQFKVEDFDVTVMFGKPEVQYHKGENGQYRTVHFFAPEALIHRAFKQEFQEYVKRCIKMHMNKVTMSKYLPNGEHVSRYVPPRIIHSGYSAYEFRKRIEARVGDIEEAKDNWDYNRAPAGAVETGKFGDLKSFLKGRKGDELVLIAGGKMSDKYAEYDRFEDIVEQVEKALHGEIHIHYDQLYNKQWEIEVREIGDEDNEEGEDWDNEELDSDGYFLVETQKFDDLVTAGNWLKARYL